MRRQPIPFLCRIRLGAALAIALTVTGAGAAEDLEHARAIFREALVLEVAGDWAAALAKFQEVGQTRLTPQVRYHLARCKEHLGRLTEALGDYRVAEAEARAAGLAETAEMERARRDLEGRVPTLVFLGDAAATALRIELDGIPIGSAVLNRPMVFNPGQHQVTLRNQAGTVQTLRITAEEGKRSEVDLRRYDAQLALRNGAVLPTADQERSAAVPTWAYYAAGAGAALVASSGVLFVVSERARAELDENCIGRLCPEEMRSVQTRGEVASTMAPIALSLGIAAIGAGVWGFVAGSRRPPPSRGQQVSSRVSAAAWPGGLGVNIAAEF